MKPLAFLLAVAVAAAALHTQEHLGKAFSLAREALDTVIASFLTIGGLPSKTIICGKVDVSFNLRVEISSQANIDIYIQRTDKSQQSKSDALPTRP